MKPQRFVLLVSMLCMAAVAIPALAHPGGITTPDPTLPPEGVYLSPADVHATYGGGALTIVLQAIQHQPFKDLPPELVCQGTPACEEHHDFDSDLFGEVSVNGGPFQPIFLEGRVKTVAYGKNSPTQPGVFVTEMLQMTLSGPPGVMVRESPTLPSLGQTSILPVGGGEFHIDSFFDVFTELSIDGGSTWIPSNGPTHVTLYLPEPATAMLIALGLVGFAGLSRRRK
jgi:PEP-CTERM motif-containing protein